MAEQALRPFIPIEASAVNGRSACSAIPDTVEFGRPDRPPRMAGSPSALRDSDLVAA